MTWLREVLLRLLTKVWALQADWVQREDLCNNPDHRSRGRIMAAWRDRGNGRTGGLEKENSRIPGT